MNTGQSQLPKGSGKSALEWTLRHRAGVWRLLLLALFVVIVLQNIEPTRVDLLFWSLPAVPKLVLMGVSALAGALIYAAVRSWYSKG